MTGYVRFAGLQRMISKKNNSHTNFLVRLIEPLNEATLEVRTAVSCLIGRTKKRVARYKSSYPLSIFW